MNTKAWGMQNTPIRILVCHPSNNGWGGAEHSLIALLERLDRTTFHVFGVTRQAPASSPPSFGAEFIRQCDAVQHMFLPVWTGNWRALSRWQRMQYHAWINLRHGGYIGPVLKMVALIRQWNIDIVYTNMIHTPVAALAARIVGVPHVWHIRESVGDDSSVRMRIPATAAKLLVDALSTSVVCNSRYVRTRMVTKYNKDSKYRVVYNGLPEPEPEPGVAMRGKNLRGSLGFTDNTIVFGMVANVVGNSKNHAQFLQVAKTVCDNFSDVRCVVFGKLPETETVYWRKLQQLHRDLCLGERLIWAGFHPDTSAIMNAIDVLVSPSLNEGFGRVVIEALLHERPLVAVASGGVGEILENSEGCILVNPEDPDAMVQAMKQLAEDALLRARMGQQGRAWAEKKFSVDAYVHAMEEILIASAHKR